MDDLSHYFTRDAIIYRRDPLGGDATCRPAKVGLVGFHIAHKTYYAPQWVWSTFEHVENVPKVGDVPIQQTDRKTKYSFYSPWMQWYAQDAATCMKQRPGVAKKMPVKPNEVTVAACPNLQNIANSHPKGVPPPPYAVVSPSPNQVTRLDKMSFAANLRDQKELRRGDRYSSTSGRQAHRAEGAFDGVNGAGCFQCVFDGKSIEAQNSFTVP